MFSRMKQIARFHVDGSPEGNSDGSSSSSIVPYSRNYSNEKYQKGLQVLQLTPIWEHIIRTRQIPCDLNVAEVFDELNERLHDPEWQVRQHALRVLVDLLIVIGDDADMYFSPLIAPLVENLGHDAPAIRKAALDSLRIYIANTNLPETIMLEILETGLERETSATPGPRYVIGVILSIPSLIQPVLLTSKRSFILRTVFNVMENKMLQIQYQEIVLKVLMKIREMIGEREFDATLPMLMKRDFELLCKVYQLENTSSNGTSKIESSHKVLNYMVEGSPAPSSYSIMPSPQKYINYPTYSRTKEKTFNVLPPEMPSTSDYNNRNKLSSFEVIDEPMHELHQVPSSKFNNNASKQQFNGCFESESFTQIDENFDITENNNNAKNIACQRSQSMHVYNVNTEKINQQRKYYSLDQFESQKKSAIITNNNDNKIKPDQNMRTYNVENGESSKPRETYVSNENYDSVNKMQNRETSQFNTKSYRIATENDLQTDQDSTRGLFGTGFTYTGTKKPQQRCYSATSNASKIVEERKLRPASHTSHIFEISSKDDEGHGKVIMETEIKLNKDTAVTMRIFETPATEDGADVSSCKSDSKLCENLEFEIDVEGLDENDKKEVNVNILTPQEASQAFYGQNNEKNETVVESDSSLDKSKDQDRKVYVVHSPERKDQDRKTYVVHSPEHKNQDRKTYVVHSPERETHQSSAPTSNRDNQEFVQVQGTDQEVKTYVVPSPEKHANRFFSAQPQEIRRSFVVQNYEDLTEDGSDENYLKTRRVTFGGEIIKMRTPDTAAENSDSDMPLRNITQASQTGPSLRNTSGDSSDSSDLQKPLEIKIPDNPIPLTYTRPNTAFAAFGSPRLPSIFTFPATSSSDADHSPVSKRVTDHRSKSATPHRTPRRNSLTILEQRLSPQPAKEVTMIHDLQRTPSPSPTRMYNRRHYGSCDNIMHRNRDLAVQTSFERSQTNSLFTEATQTSFDKTSSDENSNDSTPDSESPNGDSWESLGIINANALKNLKSQDHRLRSQGFSKLEEALKSSDTLSTIQSYLPSLLKTLLSIEKHPEIIQQKQRIVTNLILRLPLENLENNFGRILTGITKQGGPSSNLVAKSMMTRLPTAAIVTKLLSDEFLENRTSKFKENALQMIMFALTIFPSTYFDLNTCVKQAANLALDRRKRVRQPALDVLAILGQISSSKHVLDTVMDVVRYKVDADTFVSAVRQRLSRKVLPLVGTDGEVTYALQLPVSKWQQSANSYGADVDWICAGSGSVSPSSMGSKKRKTEWAKSKRQAVAYSSSSQDNRTHRKTGSFSTLPTNAENTQAKMQSRSFPELHECRHNEENSSSRFIKMPTKAALPVKFPQMPDNDGEGTNPYTGTIPKRRKQSPMHDGVPLQDSRGSTLSPPDAKMASPKQLKGILVRSAQPDLNEETRAPSPKRVQSYTTQNYPVTNISYRQPPVLHDHTRHDDSDDSTATHIIEKSELFNVNGRPKSSIVYNKDSVTITRPTTCGSDESRTDLKLTVEIEPVDRVTIKTPPRTPEKQTTFYKSQTPSPYRSTTPPRSPKYVYAAPPPDTSEFSERHVSVSFSEPPPVKNKESPRIPSPVKVLPPVEHYPDKQLLQNIQSELTISSNASLHDSYESTTDNEQYRKPPRTVKKSKQSGQGSSETTRKKRQDDSFSSKYTEKPEKPRDLIVSCFVQLQSTNWEEIMEGIENFVLLSKKHADIVDANLHLMTIELGKQIKNLRSQVARAACQAAGDLFQTHRKTIEPEAEELTANLLHRTSDTNKFLRNDAIKAIEIMTENLPPSKVIHILCFKGATHHNGLVKCATAKLLHNFVNKIGGERIYSMNRETRDKLILTCANLLMEGSLETRNYTKEIFRCLSGHPNYAKILVDVIPPRIYRNIEKALKSLR